MNRCDICLETKCKKKQCHCDTCDRQKECPKKLKPTIRITKRCTQACKHCCFSCTPECTEMMSKETADIISQFLKSNEIVEINVMGGEFFLNPEWYYILDSFLSVGCIARIVSNSDWYKNESVKSEILSLWGKYSEKFYFSLSNDKWHTNTGVEEASNFLYDNGIFFNVETEDEADDKGIVPIGRSSGECNFYGMFGCYCHNPINQYCFLIDEMGVIYKCPFGMLDYAEVKDYVNGGFSSMFKKFNLKFYDIFLPSCAACIRACGRRHS